MMVHFRKRFNEADLSRINEAITRTEAKKKAESKANDDSDPDEEPPPEGRLLIDATCAPADIRFPTDLSLVNEGREKTEELIDQLFEPLIGSRRKPRTYRIEARKAFLAITKQRKAKGKKKRAALRKQLGYLGRNLRTIDELLDCEQSARAELSTKQWRSLWIIREMHRQQQWMYQEQENRIPDRIVSISQPHVRTIVRMKAGRAYEFGAKLSVSHEGGYCFVERLSWDPYNECNDLEAQAEAYRRRHRCYPAVICADQIYRTRANRIWCAAHSIRLSAIALGRPSANKAKEQRKELRTDEKARNAIEGKFGQAKRAHSLGCIMTKLDQTSITAILMNFIVINLKRAVASPRFFAFFQQLLGLMNWNEAASRPPRSSRLNFVRVP